MEYYFIGTLLSEVKIGEKPKLSFVELKQLLRDMLTSSDYKRVEAVLEIENLENLRALWSSRSASPYGLSEHALEEFLYNELQSNYLKDYLDKYTTAEMRLQHFPELFTAYYQEKLIFQTQGFVAEYLHFEWTFLLIQSAFRSKKLNRNLEDVLQVEDRKEDLVQQLIAQKDSNSFIVPQEFKPLQEILERYYSSPIELYQALCIYKFEKLEELAGSAVFSIERILAHLLQVMIAERWLGLDKDKGSQLVDQYIKEPA